MAQKGEHGGDGFFQASASGQGLQLLFVRKEQGYLGKDALIVQGPLFGRIPLRVQRNGDAFFRRQVKDLVDVPEQAGLHEQRRQVDVA